MDVLFHPEDIKKGCVKSSCQLQHSRPQTCASGSEVIVDSKIEGQKVNLDQRLTNTLSETLLNTSRIQTPKANL